MLVSPAQEPEQLVDDRLQVQLLGGDQREALGEVEAHLMAEHRERAGAGAVALLHAVGEHVLHQIEILAHRASLRQRYRSAENQRHAERLSPERRPAKPAIGALPLYRRANEKGRLTPPLRRFCTDSHSSVDRAGRLDDRRPLGDLALHQRGERRAAAAILARNVAAEFEQPLARGLVVERLDERVGQLVDDRPSACPWARTARSRPTPGTPAGRPPWWSARSAAPECAPRWRSHRP